MTRRITKDDYEHLAEFRHALRKFLDFSTAAAKKLGLTAQQHQALLAIKGYPGRDWVTVGELAERLCTKHHSAVGLVDRMAAAGWVEREHNLKDRREVIVRLTTEGSRLLESLTEFHRAELGRNASHLGKLIRRLSIKDENSEPGSD